MALYCWRIATAWWWIHGLQKTQGTPKFSTLIPKVCTVWVLRLTRGERRITLGGDKNYDTQQLVASLRGIKATPHVAQNEHAHRSSAIDERTTRHAGYAVSQRKRKRVEEIFGWIKTIAGLRKTKHRGRKEDVCLTSLGTSCTQLLRGYEISLHWLRSEPQLG